MYLKTINLPELMHLPEGSVLRAEKKIHPTDQCKRTTLQKMKFRKKKKKWAGTIRTKVISKKGSTVEETVVTKKLTDHQVFEYIRPEDNCETKDPKLSLPEYLDSFAVDAIKKNLKSAQLFRDAFIHCNQK